MGKPLHSALQTLATNLSAVVKAQERSAREIANEAGLSNATVSNMLRGKHKASVATAEDVAHALGYELWQLLCPQLPHSHADLRAMTALIENWLSADARGRELIEHAAELAAAKGPANNS